jgi:hypothetical protein
VRGQEDGDARSPPESAEDHAASCRRSDRWTRTARPRTTPWVRARAPWRVPASCASLRARGRKQAPRVVQLEGLQECGGSLGSRVARQAMDAGYERQMFPERQPVEECQFVGDDADAAFDLERRGANRVAFDPSIAGARLAGGRSACAAASSCRRRWHRGARRRRRAGLRDRNPAARRSCRIGVRGRECRSRLPASRASKRPRCLTRSG